MKTGSNTVHPTCLEGAFAVTGSNCAFVCQTGEAAVADTATAFHFSHAEPLRTLSLHVSRTTIAAVCPQFLGATLRPTPINTARRRVASRLMTVLFEEGGDEDVDDAVFLLLRAFAADTDRTATLSAHQARLVVRAERIMRAHLASPTDVASIASELAISVNYLQKLFRQSGTTFSLRLRALRLERAHHLLQIRNKTGASVTDVMFACGFQSPEHFARAYRARFGYPPSATSGPRVMDRP